jgi:proteasome accessory factor C
MSPRATTGSEITRILALVPWLVAHPHTPKPEIAQRFGLTLDELESQLDLVLMIGVPPYSPGNYLDVHEDDDGSVSIVLADFFRRPLQLTPAEGLALLAAGRALLAVPGSDNSGPLATALAKLEDALHLPDLVVDVGEPGQLEAIRRASAHHERVEIDYWSAGRDAFTTRAIDPEVVFFATGDWYVGAYCHHARAERMFRIDRIGAVRPTGESFEPGAVDLASGEVFSPGANDPRVTLELAPEAAWVAESYPTESVTERPDGSLEIVLAVTERAWLERLLLRLGPEAKVLAPADLTAVGRLASQRILRRYGQTSKDSDRSGGAGSGRPDTSAPRRTDRHSGA